MRALVVALGSAGDVHPLVGIALELQRRGHEVTLLTNDFFESLIRRVGLDFRSVGRGEDYESATRDPDLWSPLKGLGVVWRNVFAPSIRPTYDFIRGIVHSDKPAVVASPWAFGARVAREMLRIPLIITYLQPAMLRTHHGPLEIAGVRIPISFSATLRSWLWRTIDRLYLDRLFSPALNGFRRELGLKPVGNILGQWIHSPDQGIGLFPNWYAPPQPDWPKQLALTGFPLFDGGVSQSMPVELAGFLAEGDKPVVFTPGSAMGHATEFFRASVEACLALGRRAILLTTYRDQVPARLPSAVRHFDYVPFSRLLPHAAALVYHGGIGSCAQAMHAGAPQLVVPMAHDQFDNAARVEALGVGLSVRRDRYVTRIAAEKLLRLLDSESIRARCREVANKLRTSRALTEICNLVERAAYHQQ